MLSYLLDHGPLRLLDFVDSSEVVQESFSTLPPDELPSGTRRFGGTEPLFVLTTNETISGGEDMAYSLQAFKRANAIIGEGNEATAGAANPITNPQFICEEEFGKGWWLVAVPNLKPVHEVTGSNWEGIGVKSDVVAGRGEWEGVNNAKDVARRLAMRALRPEKEL
jgi:C-terminal processing protease CtpA/Prc